MAYDNLTKPPFFQAGANYPLDELIVRRYSATWLYTGKSLEARRVLCRSAQHSHPYVEGYLLALEE